MPATTRLTRLTGRADTARHARDDVALLKGANLNFIRTSHYPPTRELVEAADRLGLYLEVEAPFCWVGAENDQNVIRAVLTPTAAMIDEYQGHPSVLSRSLANESNFHRGFERAHRLVKQLDPTRPTTFNNPDPHRICDLGNMHYSPGKEDPPSFPHICRPISPNFRPVGESADRRRASGGGVSHAGWRTPDAEEGWLVLGRAIPPRPGLTPAQPGDPYVESFPAVKQTRCPGRPTHITLAAPHGRPLTKGQCAPEERRANT